jgi:rhodanese-related sulfurtransferase
MLTTDMPKLRRPPSFPGWNPGAWFGAWFAVVLSALPVPSAEPEFAAVPSTHLHNVFRLTPQLLSGSAPEGRDAFAELARLGVRTILSVDGSKPDLATAHQFGMRYVHLPHGYDGISADLQIRLAKAGHSLPGPIYVHCHHGKHRGPAAAAVLCLADGRWDSTVAERWLKSAGTSPQYAGLYEVVRRYHPPTADILKVVSDDFPEVSKVPGLVEAMVDIDLRWDHLKLVQQAGYAVPTSHPDLQPAQEAVLLWEHYREARRLPEAAERGTNFISSLESSEALAKTLEQQLRSWSANSSPDARAQLDASMIRVGQSCTDCHRQHRDRGKTKTPTGAPRP